MDVDTVGKAAPAPPARSGWDLRLSSAVLLGKVASLASRRLGAGGGTALPGVLAAWLDSAALAKLALGLPRGTTLVTGTNGKTTTSRLLATILKRAGWQPIHNRAGANLASGVTAALLERSNLTGCPDGDSGLFEVDEAVMPRLLGAVRPRVVVLTNLFRDQLDRYGEIDFVAGLWRTALQQLPPETTVVLNADDPGIAALGRGIRARTVYFGLDTRESGDAPVGHAADSKNCPLCATPLRYDTVRYAHVGTYHCPTGDFERPPLDLAVTAVSLNGVDSSDVDVAASFGTRRWRFRLPGLYNVYNLLAAVSGALALDVPIDAIDAGVVGFSAAFGRLERITIGGRTLFVVLIKNPVGFTEVLRTILQEPGPKHLAIAINDNLADGTDVSWLWDADVEVLAGRCERVLVGGTRAGDMAVRLKYAGTPTNRVHQVGSAEQLVDDGLAGLPEGGTLYILPTYTAMIELRTLLSRRGYASYFWED
ncbi:MAG TPA: MurT ligase domain-containing protein [Chloroflexota bacterium]|nr:MurT ligase domain-containing protein [Chloroflexota bacterium]